MLLGNVSGRSTESEFTMLATSLLKKFHFVSFYDPEGKRNLGLVKRVERVKEGFMASVEVIGHRDERGFLRKPALPVEEGADVFDAEEEFIESVLLLPKKGLFLGHIFPTKVKFFLPLKKMKKHTAILAKTGAGKSYLAGVLLEELAEKGIPCVVFDPHGEYTGIKIENKNESERKLMGYFGIKPKGYKNVRIFDERSIRLGSDFTREEMREVLFPRLTASQRNLLYVVLREAGERVGIRELKEIVEKQKSASKFGIISLLEWMEKESIFSGEVKLKEIVKPRRVSILNMLKLGRELQEIVVFKVLNRLFNARKSGAINEFFVLLEEAHRFCPERGFGSAVSSGIVRELASEGRKFGVGLIVISQRPAKVDKNVLSQCNVNMILKLTGESDINAISGSVEGISEYVKGEIRNLPVGVAFVSGATEVPLFVEVRVRRSNHGPEIAEEGKDVVKVKVEEAAVRGMFKGAGKLKLLYYPMWLIGKGKFVLVDGLNGDVIIKRGNAIKRDSALKLLATNDSVSFRILSFLLKNPSSSPEKVARGMGVTLSEVEEKLKHLISKGMVKSDGYVLRVSEEIKVKVPMMYEKVEMERRKEGEFLPFRVGKGFIEKISRIINMEDREIKQVYYPYWLLKKGSSTYAIDATSGGVDLVAGESIKRLGIA